MALKTLEDEIRISSPPVDAITAPPPQEILIYFTTGNPGLIEYYRTFITALSKSVEIATNLTQYHFVGRSLGGYELNGFANKDVLPLSLQEQVEHVETCIQHYTTTAIATSKQHSSKLERRPARRRLPVILIGHSVGTYINLELIARRQKQQRLATSTSDYELVAAINLFPTIVDIARSPSGRKVSSFATSTYLAPTLSFISKILTAATPTSLLPSLVQSITGHPRDAAVVTAAFLASEKGVLQALYMGRYELLEMTHDKWTDELWDGPTKQGAATKSDDNIDRPKLYFYWGESDHWIDNATRDGVMASRAGRPGEEGKPWMEIDTRGTPHDFCISDERSEFMAGKVARYMQDITEVLSKRREEGR